MMITFPTKPENLSGIDIGGAQRLVEVVQQVLERSHHARVRVVYLQMGYDAKLTSSGGPDSPTWHKEN